MKVLECEQSELTGASFDLRQKSLFGADISPKQNLDSSMLFKKLQTLARQSSTKRDDQSSKSGIFSDVNDLKQFPNQIQETLKRYVSKKTSKNQESLGSIDERAENGEHAGHP